MGISYYLSIHNRRNTYKLTYSAKAMILLEFGEPSWRRTNFNEDQNNEGRWAKLDLLLEEWEMAHIKSEAIK